MSDGRGEFGAIHGMKSVAESCICISSYSFAGSLVGLWEKSFTNNRNAWTLPNRLAFFGVQEGSFTL